MTGIKYRPCTDCGKKKSVVLFGNRQYTLEETTKWSNLGRFAARIVGGQALPDAAKLAFERTQSAYDSDESVFTWPTTQEGLDQMYLDKETLVIDGEEVGERIMGMLKEGHWLQEEGDEEEECFPVLDEFGRPVSPSPAGTQMFTTGETIASLSRNLTPETEEATTSEKDVDMAEANDGTEEGGQGELVANQRGGLCGGSKGKGLNFSRHAPGSKNDHTGAENPEEGTGAQDGGPKAK